MNDMSTFLHPYKSHFFYLPALLICLFTTLSTQSKEEIQKPKLRRIMRVKDLIRQKDEKKEFTSTMGEKELDNADSTLEVQKEMCKNQKNSSTIKRKLMWMTRILITFLALFIGKRKLEEGLIFQGLYIAHDIRADTNIPEKGICNTFTGSNGKTLAYFDDTSYYDNQDNVILFFPGNYSKFSKEPVLYHGILFNWLAKKCARVITFCYPGYGPSTKPFILTEEALNTALDDLITDLKNKGYKTENIILVGHSLGCYAALYLASKYKFKSVFTCSAFTSVRYVANSLFPGLGYLMSYNLDNCALIQKLKCPWWGYHGSKDELVPPESLKKLEEASFYRNKNNKGTTKGEDHNSIVNTYMEWILSEKNR